MHEPLSIPIIAFDGRYDGTIGRGLMRQWRGYTTGRFRNVGIPGDHYFVSKLYREVGCRDSTGHGVAGWPADALMRHGDANTTVVVPVCLPLSAL